MRRATRRWALLPAVALFAAWLAGLIVFAAGLTCLTEDPETRTDGIVVFTGTSDRLFVGVDLLRAGRSQRLLISGVQRGIDKQTLSTAMGQAQALFDCCVDLGDAALDTAGNAVETAEWASAHSYTSLRIVTSAYHMPRSLVELRRRIPNVTLVPHPVCSDPGAIERWWAHPGRIGTVMNEFNKYLISILRDRAVAMFGDGA